MWEQRRIDDQNETILKQQEDQIILDSRDESFNRETKRLNSKDYEVPRTGE